jgi:hypothetical protein
MKAEKSLTSRVLAALKNEGLAKGQLEIAKRVLPKNGEGASLAEYQAVYAELRSLIRTGVVVEKRADEWGAPSYVYSTAADVQVCS